MTDFATRKDFWLAGVLGVLVIPAITLGFLPLSDWVTEALLGILPLSKLWLQGMVCILLSMLFFLASRKRGRFFFDLRSKLLLTLPLPMLISFLWGAFVQGNRWDDFTQVPGSVFWFLISVPIFEELLFRGWFYGVIEDWVPKISTATNGLPMACWMSSVGFALWHVQNLGNGNSLLILTQVSYGFFAGLWLGYLKWRSQSMGLPIFSHMMINFCGSLI